MTQHSAIFARAIYAGVISAALTLTGLAHSQSAPNITIPKASGGDIADYIFQQKLNGSFVGDDADDTRVYGGRLSKRGAWPAQVGLLNSAKIDGTPRGMMTAKYCGGTIIANQWILTAAHCAVDKQQRAKKPENITVRSGEIMLDKGDLRAVSHVIVHEDYDPRLTENDIALLRLAKPIEGSSHGSTGSITLISQGSKLPSGPAIVVGWGLLDNGKYPINLREADIDIVPNATCNTAMGNQAAQELGSMLGRIGLSVRIPLPKLEEAFKLLLGEIGNSITDKMICAGTASGERSSCHGDSGGPLMIKLKDGEWLQVGIVSWGRKPLSADPNQPCGHPEIYAVYTRLSSYFDWIEKTIQENGNP